MGNTLNYIFLSVTIPLMKKTVTVFTEGKILGPLIKFALPVLLALFLQTMYGAVDLLIIGQFCESSDVSAVATGSTLMFTLTSLFIGLSMGTTILLGQNIGKGKTDGAGDVIGSTIVSFAVLGVIVGAITLFLAPGMATVLQAPEEAFDATVTYVRICAGGLLFIIAFNVLGSVFRGIGNSVMPLISVTISTVINIIGDLVLIAVFNMGVAGAAIATVFAQIMSVILSVLIIRKQNLPFKITKNSMKPNENLIRQIFRLGLPIAFQDMLVSTSFLFIMGIVNTLGLVASASVGVSQRLSHFIMLLPSAYMQSMSAFVAQNVGAGKHDRARKALYCGIGTSLFVSVFMAYLSFFHGDVMAAIFTRDPLVMAGAWNYLKAFSIDTLLVSFLFCFIGYFNGYGKTTFVMIQGLIGAFGTRIPVSFIMSRLFGDNLFMVGLATPASSVVQIILCMIVYVRLQNKLKKTQPA